MKIKYTLFIFLIILFGYLVATDLHCVNYNGNFHYSSHVTSFHLKELIATEGQSLILLVRLFHNKFTVFAFDIFARYIQFFNIFYLINILGLAGLVGFLYFYYSFFTQAIRNKFIKLFASTILFFPFLEIFQLTGKSFILKMAILIIPFQVASFIGLFYLTNRKNYIWIAIYFILLILSVGWIIVFQSELLNFCTSS